MNAMKVQRRPHEGLYFKNEKWTIIIIYGLKFRIAISDSHSSFKYHLIIRMQFLSLVYHPTYKVVRSMYIDMLQSWNNFLLVTLYKITLLQQGWAKIWAVCKTKPFLYLLTRIIFSLIQYKDHYLLWIASWIDSKCAC